MKMKMIFVMAMLLCIPSLTQAQKNTFITGFRLQGSAFPKEFRTVEYGFDMGYNFTDKLYGNLRIDRNVALFKKNGVKDYTSSYSMGLDAGYTIFKYDKLSVGVQAGAGLNHRVKADEWKYVYYEGQTYMDLGEGSSITPRFSIGVRHYHSRTDLYPNRTTAFASIAFRLNWK